MLAGTIKSIIAEDEAEEAVEEAPAEETAE